jgi:hypothetical protein
MVPKDEELMSAIEEHEPRFWSPLEKEILKMV